MLAGTIVASNYLAMAQVLARSYLDAHADGRFVILVVDDGEADRGSDVDDDRVEVWRLADLDLPPHELAAMLTMYEVREFSTAVKPPFLQALLAREDVACYIDPDIAVYAAFDDLVVDAAREHDIVLTPHVLHPVPRDGRDVSEQTLQLAGMFNLGFIGVGRAAEPFLRWWGERLLTDAVIDFSRGLFTDQRWVDWVPALFRHHVCRDPGMNIAWWNAHERQVELDSAGRPTVDGGLVRFVHYSGYDPQRPEVFSHWQPKPRQAWRPGDPLRVLAERYGEELIASGHFERRRRAYQYDVADDGTPLTADLRRHWRASLLDELAGGRPLDVARTPPAFGSGSEGFGRWLDGVGGGTVDHPHSRRERLVWDRRADLRAAFPDVDGADAAGFRRWLDLDPDARTELGEHRPPWYAPPTPAAPEARPVARRVASRGAHLVHRAVDRTRGLVAGAEHGVADPARRRVAFLHVPKSAGTSLADVVRDALPDHRWAPWVFDPDQFGPYADRDLPDELATATLPDPAAFREYDAASGHFSLPSLLAGFDVGDVVVILREPRCRLLSLHEYWRNLDDAAATKHDPWADVTTMTAEADFGDWLLDARAAYQTDNIVARMVVPHHPLIPTEGFIPADAADALADAVIAELDRVGWVDVVERGDAMWRDLGGRLGSTLTPDRRNVTVERSGRRPPPIDQLLGAGAATNLRRRTAVDRAVWTWAAARRDVADPGGLADVEWSRRVAAALRR